MSSDRQDVDLSVSAQLRALRDYAKANGYSVAREYVDAAESGRVADPYSALSELLVPHEISILCRRLEAFLEVGEFPYPGPRRGVPWPPM